MHCGTCLKKFSLMRTRKQCSECRRYYCKHCVMRKANKNINCENCAVLTSRPLSKSQLLKMKARDLQLYLTNKQVSTKGCIEKEDLVNILLAYANGADFQSSPNPESSPSSGRHLFKNIRSFFGSSPDVTQRQSDSANSGVRENTSNTFTSPQSTPHSASRIRYNEVPSYYDSVLRANNTSEIVQPSAATFIQTEISVEPTSSRSDTFIDPSDFLSQSSVSDLTHGTTTTSDSDVTQVNMDDVSFNFTPSEQDFLSETASTMPLYDSFKDLKLSDIKDETELNELSIQQLKYLLMRNRVDFKGCVEKTELLERVRRLWVEYGESRKGLENLPLEDLCKICMDAPIECVMLECGHMATCTTCGKQLNECPICRQYVVRVVRTFRV